MTKQITLEELLKLVTVEQDWDDNWRIVDVKGNVHGDVGGSVCGDVGGSVKGDVRVSVFGTVYGSIGGREWQYVETPKDKLKRLIEEGANQEQLLEAFNQLEDNC
tara:strand:+ start:189 stop:503 length:315 start_codon:yes stop_codon:yes gene_type:complete